MKRKPEIGQAGAEVTPIEVTPEMRRAGVVELGCLDQGWEDPDEALRRVLVAVFRAEVITIHEVEHDAG